MPYFFGSSFHSITPTSHRPPRSVFCMVLFRSGTKTFSHASLSLFLCLAFSHPSPHCIFIFFFSFFSEKALLLSASLRGWPFLQLLPIMVVPPARAAFDPWAKSSTVVVPRYGIWKWVWMSIPPGITIFPLASMVFTPPGTIRLSPICLSSEDDVIVTILKPVHKCTQTKYMYYFPFLIIYQSWDANYSNSGNQIIPERKTT